ncbi:MAG: peptidoglycan glycosyltransferase, cell division protein FtsI (penicillin-binding protein 3) [Candidatus Berkelbacteria bacterium]|nr:peptidoglycan glycosyltransferase, cell division protein FtsI (penicillin-binding protein 3) [Candidatus Berkelbacteria bacterium]
MENIYWYKRLNFLLGIFICIAAGLLFRLFQKQVLGHAAYAAQAEDQYIVKKDLPAQRGKIYASDQFPLASNKQFYQVLAIPRNIKNPDDVAEKLGPLLDIQQSDIFTQINNDKNYVPPLKHSLLEGEADKIAALKLKGIIVLPESKRFYPEGELASQVLGFVNDTGKGENVLSKAVKKYSADSGSIVVMDPNTGAILAMAGEPTFDPNKFNEVPKEDQNVFNNPTIARPWEPGSVFKPLIMAAAINEGKVQPDTEGVFSNMVTVDSYEIHTSTDQAYGRETMTQVLENSDNVAMVWVSEQLGKDTEYKYLKDFGFGRKTGIELDTEASGEVLDVKQWSNSLRATVSFGQGITVTPIQLGTAVSAIANGGKIMKPYIVSEVTNADGTKDFREPKEVKRVFNTDVANKVKDMMVSVVINGHGKKAAVSGYKVAGKTGTAQVPSPGGGYYKDRHIGSFIGFAPADDPKFVMLVRLDQPKNVDWAESSAAPTFGELANWLLDYFRVPPTEG